MEATLIEQVLLNLLDDWTVPDLPEAVGVHLYHAALRNPAYHQVQRIVRVLSRQGWTKWDNFAVRWAQKNGQIVSYWEVIYLLEQMPVPAGEKTAQLKEVDRLVQGKKLRLRQGYWPASEVQKYLDKWEQESLQRGEKEHG